MKILRLVLLLILGVCTVAGAVAIFGPQLERRAGRARERDALRTDNDEIERRIAELRRRRAEFENNPEYVELEARREGKVKPGETVFDFGDLSAPAPTP